MKTRIKGEERTRGLGKRRKGEGEENEKKGGR